LKKPANVTVNVRSAGAEKLATSGVKTTSNIVPDLPPIHSPIRLQLGFGWLSLLPQRGGGRNAMQSASEANCSPGTWSTAYWIARPA
jgi:hypothetical protein